MTSIAIPNVTGDSADSLRWQRLARIQALCRAYLGREPEVTDDGTTLTVTFTPDLTPAEAQTLAAIVHISGIGVVTPTEFYAVLPDVATCTAFVGLTNPTNAQAVAALKSLIRIVGVIVRD